jgi:hypothetical protein
MSKEINIVVKNLTKEQKFDAGVGCLDLKKAENFSFTIKAMYDLEKTRPSTTNMHASNKTYEKYHANLKVFQAEQAKLIEKYKDLSWCWQLVGNGIDPKLITHNNSFTKGIADMKENGYTSFKFSEFLEGGGMVWLEAFDSGNIDVKEHHDQILPTGKSPRGIFVRALGTPKIIGVQWKYTDASGKVVDIPKDATLKFGQTIQLHVYTKGLYGQEIDIQLMNKDLIIDDKLPALKRENGVAVDLKPGQLVPDMPSNTYFRREVVAKIVEGETVLSSAPQGILKTKKDSKTSMQKAVVDIILDPFWTGAAFANSQEITLYAKVKHDKSEELVTFKDDIVKIKGNAVPEVKIDSGNNPLTVGKVETNVASFSPCRYDRILLDSTNFKKAINVYTKDQQNAYQNKPIEIVSKQKDNTVQIILDKLNTSECANLKKAKDHNEPKNKFKISSNVVNPFVVTDSIFFDAVPPLLKEISFANTFGIDPKKYIIETETCAHNKRVELHVYPELGYEFSVRIGSGDPMFVRQSKAMTNRKYLHQADFFGNKQTEKINLKRREDYKEEKKAKLLKFDEYELGFEYTIDGIDEPVENLTLNGDTPIVKIFDIFMWMINNIRELSGDKAYDEAEKDHQEAKKSGINPKNKYFNKVTKAGKRFNRNIPLRIEVSQPKLAGTVKWIYSQSVKAPERVGTLYTFNLKADPLIEVTGTLDLLFIAQFIPYVGAAVKGMTRFADGVGMMDDVVNFFLPKEDQIVIDLDYKLDMKVSGSLELAAEPFKYHNIDGWQAGDFDIISKIEIGVVANIAFVAKFGNTEIITEAGAKVAAKWTISKKIKKDNEQTGYKNDPWEIHFDGIYLEVYAKLEVTNSNDKTPKPKNAPEPPTRFCIQPSFTHEFQLYNPE